MKVVAACLLAILAALGLFEGYARLTKAPNPAWKNAEWFIHNLSGATWDRYRPYTNIIEDPFSSDYPFSWVDGETRAVRLKPPDVFRIILLGGSMVQSPALERANNYNLEFAPSQRFTPAGAWWRGCASELAKAAPPTYRAMRFEFLSAGMASTITTNEAIRILTADLLDWSPDMIVMMDGYNDIYSSMIMGRAPGMDPFVPDFRFRFEHPLSYGLYKQLTWSEGATQLFKAHLERNMIADLPNPSPQQLVDRMTKTYNFVRAVAHGAGARFAVISQPTAVMHSGANKPSGSTPAAVEAFRLLASSLPKWAKQRGALYASYQSLFADLSHRVFYDDVHFTGEGYAILCERMARDLGTFLSESPTEPAHRPVQTIPSNTR